MDCRPFRLHGGVCSFSPDGRYVAISSLHQLVIRSVAEFHPVKTVQCLHIVEVLEWSTDSELVLCAYPAAGVAEIWSLSDPKWKCRIRTGSYGLVAACFTPDSRHVLTTAKLHVRLTIWSLSSHVVSHIDMPKEASPSLDFSVGGSYMAVAERRIGKDCVAIYSCSTWCQISVIDCGTIDLGGLKWSPDGSKICIWDGSYRGKISIYHLDGLIAGQIDNVFGVHNVEWSPSAQILAVASVGSKILLVNHLTWKPIATLNHSKIGNTSQSFVVFCESSCRTKYHIASDRLSSFAPILTVIPGGRLSLSFSPNARYLAVLDSAQNRMLWIWDVTHFSLAAVLVHLSAIKDFKWSYVESRMAIVCGTSSVYTWTPVGAAVADLAGSGSYGLRAELIEWNACAGGHYLMVSCPEAGCICRIKYGLNGSMGSDYCSCHGRGL